MSVLTQANGLHDVLKYEEDLLMSREVGTVASGKAVVLGEVVGRITKALGTVAAGGNTGNGALSDVGLQSQAKVGEYVLTCITAATGGGVFSVLDPDGFRMADATAGSAYENSALSFTITPGTTDFVAGDVFTVPVAIGSKKVVPLNPDAVDGSARAWGVSIAAYDASSTDVSGVFVTNNAVIVASGLVWPEGISDTAKNQALEDLAGRGVNTREEA